MACIYQLKSGKYKTGFLRPYLYIHRDDGTKVKLTRFNTAFIQDTGPSIYDNKYYSKTIGYSGHRNITEIIIKGGKMSQLRINKPAVTIPKNGYAVIASNADCAKLKKIYKQGKRLAFDALPFTLTNEKPKLKFEDMKFCISAGTYLVKKGEIQTKFTHIPSTTPLDHVGPRSAFGISEDGKKMFLVTVDKQIEKGVVKSTGMSLETLAGYMKSIGCHYALHFDCNGSVESAAKIPGTNDVIPLNIPTDAGGRHVANAIGFVSTQKPDGKPIGTKIITSDRMFPVSTQSLSLNAWDRAIAPCKIDPKKIEWSVDNANAILENGKLKGVTTGLCTVKATYLGITSFATVRVLGNPVALSISTSSLSPSGLSASNFTASSYSTQCLYVFPKTKNTLDINAISSDGYAKSLKNSVVSLTISGKIGKTVSQTFLSSSAGVGYIQATWKGLTAAVPVSIKNMSGAQYYPSTTKLKLPSNTSYLDPSKVKFNAPANKTTTPLFLSILGLNQNQSLQTKAITSFTTCATKKKVTSFMNNEVKYSTTDSTLFRIINLKTSLGGLISYKHEQLSYLTAKLTKEKNRNIIITMNLPPSKWKDPLEMNLFYKIVQGFYERTGKFVTVVWPGSKFSVHFVNGIRIIEIEPLGASITPSNNQARYIEFRVTTTTLQYSVKILNY